MDRRLRRLTEARPFEVPPRTTAPRARPNKKLFLLPATAFAAAAAVVAVLALTGGGRPPANEHAPEAAVAAPKDARQVLLAAATRIEATQPSTGRYWLTKTEDGHLYDVGDYNIRGRVSREIWVPLSSQDNFVFCSRWLGFQPITDADRAAWQRAGSPSTLNADHKQPTRALTLDPGQRVCNSMQADEGGPFTILGTGYSLDQIRALPTDPAQLKTVLYNTVPDRDAETLFLAASDILLRVPASPALQAAAYRMLADLPGISYVDATDALGRHGSGVEHSFPSFGTAKFAMRMVIDLGTGQTLAHEQRNGDNGDLVYYQVFTGSELTDQSPPTS